MPSKTRLLIFGLSATAATGMIAGPAAADLVTGDGGEIPITGQALERASTAALAEVGGGTVTDTEVGDEEGYYEVEVTLDDGRQVDVHLDRDFTVIGTEADGPDDSDRGPDPDGTPGTGG